MTAPPTNPPHSTYRVQISESFTLVDVAERLPYLQELGVGSVYVSPLLRSTDGSPHGYDVVDHRIVDPSRGGEWALRMLAIACRASKLGLVVDIVPNHMGVTDAGQNRAWWLLLERGPGSHAASWFDVDWEYGRDKVVLPVVDGDPDPSLLSTDGVELRYAELRWPLAPGSYQPGDPLEKVLDRQHYRPIDGRDPDNELNYRRFFAVSELAGVRVEDPDVYRASHREVLRWVEEYELTGLRIDHPDGLADPQGYLERLAEDAPGVWITVEKITDAGEDLPPAWPVAGTTGYDALAEVNGLLVDPSAEEECDQLYRQLTGDTLSWSDHSQEAKAWVAATMFQPEVARIARLAGGGSDTEAAVATLAASFPVYRSYLPAGRHHLDTALEEARRRRPGLGPVFASLWTRLTDPADEVCVRFQQLTGAVRAKGVEDTAFYRFNRMISLNEVGSDPGSFGLSVDDFHVAQARRLVRHPHTMTTLSTHDTKRGEDLRARLAVLAEMPSEWGRTAELLMDLAPIPDASFAYLLWQTFVASGLIDRDRMHRFAEKAMREAAVATSWSCPDERFEGSVHRAVDAAYDLPEVRRVIEEFASRLEPYGWSNSTAQKLIQLTMPGVPDVYQGSEMHEGSLVDPDNRRPVDFGALADALHSLQAAEHDPPPLGPVAKLWLTHRALLTRRDHADLFVDYRPILLPGPRRHHLVAFDRGGAITLATRLPRTLEQAGGWGDARLELPAGRYRDVLTGRVVRGALRMAEILDQYPVALLLIDGGE